jgi:septum formation protein
VAAEPAGALNVAWRVVLASASPARLRLLTSAGITCDVMVSGVDEDRHAAGHDDQSPTAVCLHLARAKAQSVAARVPGQRAVVIGADSVLDVDGVPQGKPASVAEARRRLQRLQGTRAVLRTGHCVIRADSGEQAAGVVSTEVEFGTWTDAELQWYLATGESLHVAGGFTLDGLSAPFMAGVVGDPGNVIGLSLPGVRGLLHELGLSWTDIAPAPRPA